MNTSDKVIKKPTASPTTRVISKGKLVKLRARELPAGGETLYLDYVRDGKRKTEFLKLKLTTARTAKERQDNKDTLLEAEAIRAQRELDLGQGNSFVSLSKLRKANFLTYFQEALDSYSRRDQRMLKAAYRYFIEFCGEREVVGFSELTESYLRRFKKFLDSRLNGETPHNYFKVLKKVIRQAVQEELLPRDPTTGIKLTRQAGVQKEVLTMGEVQQLVNYPYSQEVVSRAFLYCCVTGLRFCDVKELTWRDIDLDNKVMVITQAKTKREASVNLNPSALVLLGERGDAKPKELIFPLPSHTACAYHLQKWVTAAGIDKKITWHCARHSFGTNLIIHGNDLKTVSGLLGHSSIVETQKYVRYVDALKEQAVASLPDLF